MAHEQGRFVPWLPCIWDGNWKWHLSPPKKQLDLTSAHLHAHSQRVGTSSQVRLGPASPAPPSQQVQIGSPMIRCWERTQKGTAISLTVVCSSSVSESLSSSAQREGCKQGPLGAQQLPHHRDHQPFLQDHSPPRHGHPPRGRALAERRHTRMRPPIPGVRPADEGL